MNALEYSEKGHIMDEIGYIYGFTNDEVQNLEAYKFVSQLRA